MTNYVVAFDTKSQGGAVEKRIQSLTAHQAHRLLDSVWLLQTEKSGEQIYEHLNSALGVGDRLIVIQSAGATYRDLLTPSAALVKAHL
jgi:hypothetical protein